jgi:GntR family histidine utilization transcriptional repressor
MTSLDARIRADLEAKIRSGEWSPGDRIPTEHALMAVYGCARMTVHKAISALVAQGLIDRRKKAGSFVARPHVQTAVLEIPDIGALIAGRGEAYVFDLLKRTVGGSGAAHEAGFAASGEVLALDGLHMADGRPFALEHRLISLAAAPEAREVDFAREAPGSWLLGHIPWTEARHRITARNAGAEAGRRLATSASTACLQVERWTWRQGEPVTYVRQLFPGELYDLVAEFTPGAPKA